MRHIGSFFALTRIALACGVLAGLFTVTPAHAQFDAYWHVCAKGRGEAAVISCDWLLKSGKLTPAQRPMVYWYRCWGNVVFMRRYKAAVADCSAAIRLKPDDARFWLDRGLAWARQGRYDKSIPDYTEAIRLKADYVLAYNNRAIDYRKTRQWAKSIADYETLIGLRPRHPQAYLRLGNLYERQKSYAKALAIFSRSLKLFPGDAGAIHIRRARTHERLGNKIAAIADYRAALRIDPEDEIARTALKRLGLEL